MPDKYKFNEADKTFETRLVFLLDIFNNKYSQTEILKNCIEYKLNKSYEQYLDELNKTILNLQNKEKPIKILDKVKK